MATEEENKKYSPEFLKRFEEIWARIEERQAKQAAEYEALSPEEKARREREYQQMLKDYPMLARWAAEDEDIAEGEDEDGFL